jgi:hypothetical protein
MSDGGKGDKPRPFSVGLDKFDEQFDNIFGKKEAKGHCEVCNKSPTWCQCKEKQDGNKSQGTK